MVKKGNSKRNQRGFVLIASAFLVTAIVGIGAIAIDMAYVMEVKSEVQHVADVAARAAASGLTINTGEARRRAHEYALLNPVLGRTVNLNDKDVVFGIWDSKDRRFIPTINKPTAARVTVRWKPTLFLAPVLGVGSKEMSATGIAAVGSPSIRDVVLALDKSGSMGDDGNNPPQPFTDVKEQAKRFLKRLEDAEPKDNQAGLVYFNHTAQLVTPLTGDFGLVKDAVDSVLAPSGGTDIAAALRASHQELISPRVRSSSLKVAVLLSDGQSNFTAALAEATLMAQDGIILFTISLGVGADRVGMEQLALVTGGQHFFSPTPDQLDSIFKKISTGLGIKLVE